MEKIMWRGKNSPQDMVDVIHESVKTERQFIIVADNDKWIISIRDGEIRLAKYETPDLGTTFSDGNHSKQNILSMLDFITGWIACKEWNNK